MKVQSGYRYRVYEPVEYDLPAWWPLEYRFMWSSDWLQLREDTLRLKRGYCWNGADNFPDYDWIIVPSAVHDGFLQVLQDYVDRGYDQDFVDEYKALIDRWFSELAQDRAPLWRKWFTKAQLFIGVNKMSKLVPGSQAKDHRIREYA